MNKDVDWHFGQIMGTPHGQDCKHNKYMGKEHSNLLGAGFSTANVQN
jgi:hypothetical protein